MLVDYPYEWHKYFIPGRGRTFVKETPEEIKRAARRTNESTLISAGKPFFFFEEDDDK